MSSTHLYTEDARDPPDHRGQRRCTCGLPAANRVHEVPERPPEVRAEEARRVGERE